MDRIIFLDFDGVLNCTASFIMHNRRGKEQMSNHRLCPICCSNFRYLIDKVPDAQIVISSTWRLLHPLDMLKGILMSHNAINAGEMNKRIIDITPDSFGKSRGREIEAWLQNKYPDFNIMEDDGKDCLPTFLKPDNLRVAILDDTADMGDMSPFLVKTEFDTGLTIPNVHKAADLLGRPISAILA